MYKSLVYSVPVLALYVFLSSHAHAADNGIAAALHQLKAEGGRVCQVGHFHIGTSPLLDNKDKAIKLAMRNWSEFTTMEYGTSWGSYNAAADRTTDCSQENATQWICKVKARPCRAGLSTASR